MWILILTVLGYQSGAAITAIPNFESAVQCDNARLNWLNAQSSKFDADWRREAFTTVCVLQSNDK